ncbi:uncharacterized protein [Anoplolepis gracilipes]|uniref:uncharacterized protein n=1 Tax=Anoplolepis gracilipes TaxID=354296 RepID=UPI003B9F02A9
MKVLVLCICALLLGIVSSNLAGDEIKRNLKSAVSTVRSNFMTCMTENNVTEDEWYEEEEIMTDVHKESGNEERTRKLGCTVACVLKKENLMEDGNIKEGKVHAKINRDYGNLSMVGQIHKFARDCMKKARNITEECEKGFSLFDCLLRTVHKFEEHEEHEKTETRESEGEEQTVFLVLCICALLLGIVSSNLAGDEIKREFKSAVSTYNNFLTCMTENNVTEDDWYAEEEIMTDVHEESGNEERTRKLGCTVACLLKKENLMEDSNIKEGKVHAKISREYGGSLMTVKIHRIVRDCMKEVRNITEECEKSFSLLSCAIRGVHNLEKHEEHEKSETRESEEAEQTV